VIFQYVVQRQRFRPWAPLTTIAHCFYYFFLAHFGYMPTPMPRSTMASAFSAVAVGEPLLCKGLKQTIVPATSPAQDRQEVVWRMSVAIDFSGARFTLAMH
jgi:hypothetical protein